MLGVFHFHTGNCVIWALFCISRDQLKRNCSLNVYKLNLKLQDLNNFDSYLAQELIQRPADYIATVCDWVPNGLPNSLKKRLLKWPPK